MTRANIEQAKFVPWFAKAGAACSIVPIGRFVSPSIFALKGGGYGCLFALGGIDEEGLTDQELEARMRSIEGALHGLLAMTFGGDPPCTDCNRVLRVPGFLNQKCDPAFRLAVEYPDDSIWTPDDFRLDAATVDATLCAQAVPSRRSPSKHSNSENDWAWVCEQLTQGKDAVKLTRELASQRSDKPNPVYYAQRTLDVASARIWLLGGIRIDDVITMLESRRRFEIPAAIAGARAREIAATAERMIARRKTA
ncbi:MAG TPA: DNA-primase RepB domain-containing protein [Acidobacteriaceae bacterium]|jgi:hypothetical protein|nr:DNA-primase RepB domain-containing protein [Acidobacteriaceae bacterium]